MKTPLRLLGALLVTLTIAFSSRDARALGPVGIEVGAKVGYATDALGGPVNALGVGIGGRGGVVLFDSLYAGINVIDYLGGSGASALQYGGELGYGFKALILTIRPQIGAGNLAASYSGLTFGNFYLEPGLTLLIPIGILFVGADANALILPSTPDGGGLHAAFTMHGQVGLNF